MFVYDLQVSHRLILQITIFTRAYIVVDALKTPDSVFVRHCTGNFIRGRAFLRIILESLGEEEFAKALS